MSKTITINRFNRGKAEDRFSQEIGKFAIAKHFDILTYPKKLQPLRGMSMHTAGTLVGNIIAASDGLMYGTGSTGSQGRLYALTGYGGSDDFVVYTTTQLSGGVVNYEFLVDWPDSGASRTIMWASANLLCASQTYNNSSSAQTIGLTFTTIGQGFVHPKDKILYFPYRTSSTAFIGLIAPNGTIFGGLNATAFSLQFQYQAYCLSYYGNYLAVPLTGATATSSVNGSIVALWDRDTTNTLFSETIPWGAGALKVLNNLLGTLIGVSEYGSPSLQAGTAQDYNAIQIKIWNGGAEPTVIAEIRATALSGGSGSPSVLINQRVNYIQNNRLYFSAIVNPNDGIQPSRIGIWSVGKNDAGEWTVNLEKVATNANTETSIIAAAMVGDYTEVVYNAAGTLAKSTNGSPSSSTYGATSVYESLVNPQMPEYDSVSEKTLESIGVNFEPLPSGASVVFKYRVNSKGNDADWITVKTFSTAGDTSGVSVYAMGETLKTGDNFEFRIESTGGAVVTAFSYKYKLTTSANI